MKKAIIASLLVSALVASAFAQVTFSGSVYAGIQFQKPHDGDETITTTHREEGAPKFNFITTIMRENYGARLDITFMHTGAEDPEGHFSLNGIYGWVNLFDNSLRLTMGQISSTPWVLTRFHSSHTERKLGDIRGFRVDYSTPIQGLSLGAAFRADDHNLETFGEQMILGASFIHPMFNMMFAYDLANNVHTLFGFNFSGIPDLTAGVQLRAIHLASWDDEFHPGELQVRQIVGYRIMRPLNVYLILGQTFHGMPGLDVGLEFTPGIEYRFLPNLTGSLSMTIESPDHFTTTNLILRPSLELTLTGPAFFYLEYELFLNDMDRASHTFGFGMTIRAF